MKNILITAGGTSEPIDHVRSITNTGTGRLGSIIADTFAQKDGIGRIFYLCSASAVRPSSERITVIEIKTTADLQTAVQNLLAEQRIDAVIHSMAVSDYTVRAVTSAEELAKYLQKEDISSDPEKRILQAMEQADIRTKSGKISSQIGSPLLLLKQTPKILPLFRELSPSAVVVGFKLLSDTTEKVLFDTAFRLLQQNRCDFVLANDSAHIHGDRHTGYLIDRQKNVVTFHTKQEIAEGIANAVIEEMEKKV